MRSALFSAEHLEKESAQPGLRLQNSKLLKIELNGEAMARTGSMVAYQGHVQFQALGSGGLGNFLKRDLDPQRFKALHQPLTLPLHLLTVKIIAA